MKKRYILLLFCLFGLTATMGGSIDCDNDNPDCEFFCDDD